MKQTKIKTGFTKFGDDRLEGYALAIATAMRNNTHFPEPLPALADLDNSIQLYSNALALAKTGDKVKIAIKNKLRQDLLQVLVKLANYCSHIAQGERPILASSGFNLNAESTIAQPLGYPENFTVLPGNNSGEAYLYINSVPKAKSYLFFYSPSPVTGGAWLHAVNSSPYFTITGLIPGTTYSFKIGATGTKGQVIYTEVISKMIL